MSLRAFWQQIGSIWLIGRHPEFPSLSDPLVVEDIENTFFELQSWQEMVAQEGKDAIGPFRAVIAPDDYHKDNVSGGDWYGIALPCRTVDAKLLSESHETTFVNYLRLTFQAKGFPGAARLPDALENLDIGLIEI